MNALLKLLTKFDASKARLVIVLLFLLTTTDGCSIFYGYPLRYAETSLMGGLSLQQIDFFILMLDVIIMYGISILILSKLSLGNPFVRGGLVFCLVVSALSALATLSSILELGSLSNYLVNIVTTILALPFFLYTYIMEGINRQGSLYELQNMSFDEVFKILSTDITLALFFGAIVILFYAVVLGLIIKWRKW